METLWKRHAVRVGVSGLSPGSPKARGACCGVTRGKKAYELLYGSPSRRHHHRRASPPHRRLTLPQPAPFPGHFPPSPHSAQPLRQSPPGPRRCPSPSSPAAMGVAIERAGRGGRVDWPRLSRGRSSVFSANRQLQGAGLPALMAGGAVAAVERGAAGGECGWVWGGGCEVHYCLTRVGWGYQVCPSCPLRCLRGGSLGGGVRD